jgi:hypothetical protein
MLSFDKFVIEQIAKSVFPVLIDGTLHNGETTYERMRDLVMLARTVQALSTILLNDTRMGDTIVNNYMMCVLRHCHFDRVPVRTLRNVLGSERCIVIGNAFLTFFRCGLSIYIDPEYAVFYDYQAIYEYGEGINCDASICIAPTRTFTHTLTHDRLTFGRTITDAINDLTTHLKSVESGGYISRAQLYACMSARLTRAAALGSSNATCIIPEDRVPYYNAACDCSSIIRERVQVDHLSARDLFILGVILSNEQMIREAGYKANMLTLVDYYVCTLALKLDFIDMSIIAIDKLFVTTEFLYLLSRLCSSNIEGMLYKMTRADLLTIIKSCNVPRFGYRYQYETIIMLAEQVLNEGQR